MASWVGDLITHLSIAIICPLLVALLVKKFPFAKQTHGFSMPDQAQQLYYKRYERYLNYLTFLTVPFLIYLFYSLYDLDLRLKLSDKLVKIAVVPDYIYWCCIGLFLGLGLLTNINEFWGKLLLRAEYKDYIVYSNMRNGYNSFKAAKTISAPFWVVAIIGVYFLWNAKVLLYDNQILFRDDTSLKTISYSYKDVRSILFTDTGKKPYTIVQFKDNNVWDTRDFADDSAHTAIKFVSKKSGVKTDTLSMRSKKVVD